MKVVVSAPGKVHLMGEHAVVHGKPALLAAVNLRMQTSVMVIDKKSGELVINCEESPEYIEKIVSLIKEEFKIEELPSLSISIHSDISVGYHLGSSAATAVSVVGALMYALKKIWNPIRINEIAYEAEKFKHGTPSGGDNTAVTFGGLLWYRKELEFLRSMWQLPFKPHTQLINFFLLDTGRSVESTGELVAHVRRLVDKKPKIMREIFDENEIQTKRLTVALKEGDEKTLVDAIRLGSKTLVEMGVVSKYAQDIISQVEKLGGAAKILGGGGRKDGVGYLLCYHRNRELVEKRIGAVTVPIILGEEGVRLEKKLV